MIYIYIYRYLCVHYIITYDTFVTEAVEAEYKYCRNV